MSTYGIMPGGGIDPTAKEAADKVAQSGRPFFLPPGNYTTYKLTLKLGTEIQDVPGKSVLRYNGGGALINIENAADIRLTGLTLDGEAKPIDGGALLVAERVKGLTVSDCRIIGSAEDGSRSRAASPTARLATFAMVGCSARTRPDSRSRITMCMTAATTASSSGARRLGRHHRHREPHRAHRRKELRQRAKRQWYQCVSRGFGY